MLHLWSALVHVRDNDPEGARCIARPKLVELAGHVAKGICCVSCRMGPGLCLQCNKRRAEAGVSDVSPYRQDPRCQVELPFDMQRVVAWLLPWDRRLVLRTQLVTRAHLPGSNTVSYGPYAHAFGECQPGHCKVHHRAAQLRQVILCQCAHPVPEEWNVFSAAPMWTLLAGRTLQLSCLLIDPRPLPVCACVSMRHERRREHGFP